MEVSTKLKTHPHANASRLSKMFFWWLRDLFRTRSETLITHDNVYENLKQHKTEYIYEKFMRILNSTKHGRKPKSILSVFLEAYGFWSLTLGVLYSITDTIITCAQSYFIGRLLFLLKSFDESTANIVYLFMAGIAVCSLLNVIILHPFMLYILEIGMKIRIGCYSLIYHKIFTMRNSSKNNLCGQIFTLMSNDIERFSLALSSLHCIWKGILQIFILGYFIVQEIGTYGLVGIIFILCFIPFNFLFSKKSANYRAETAIQTDLRMRILNEIISKIQTIKMFVLESYFFQQVRQARSAELKAIKGSLRIYALLLSFWSISKISFFLSFLVFVYCGNPITAGSFYMLSTLFSNLGKSVVYELPVAMIRCSEAKISLKRVDDFLFDGTVKDSSSKKFEDDNNNNGNADNTDDTFGVEKPTKKPSKLGERKIRHSNQMKRRLSRSLSVCIEKNILNGTEIFIQNTTARYPDEEGMKNPAIKAINLDVKSGKLYAVTGAVGSGKSSLMNLLLEELQIVSGNFYVNKELSYASQEPWLFPGSIRDNIVFIEEYDEERYKTVLSVCGLEVDLQQFPHGDQTLISSDANNLSGGQKSRINLARAVYKQSKLYLLDDIFSALDPDVSKFIFQKCIQDFLKSRTVILVTHNQNFLMSVDYVINMNSGNIHVATNEIEKSESSDSSSSETSQEDPSIKPIQKYSSKQELDQENKNHGSVGFSVYFKYFGAVGNFSLVFFVLFLQVAAQVTISAIDWFLSRWMNWEGQVSELVQNSTTTLEDFFMFDELSIEETRDFFQQVFVVAVACLVIVVTTADISFFYLCFRAAKNLFFMLYNGVTNTFLSFFTSNPSGRILNRFSKDIGNVDYLLPETFYDSFKFILECTGNVILINTVNYWLFLPTFLMAILLVVIRFVYIKSSRNIKRLEASTRSPVLSHIKSVVDGLSTIRAFKAEQILFRNQFCNLQDTNTCSYFLYISAKRAFAFWIDILCVLYIAAIMFALAILNDKTSRAGSIGLAISLATKLIHLCQWGIKQTALLENQMISVERVLEYANLPSEYDSKENVLVKPNENWPESGRISFEKFSMRYSPDGPLILKNMDLEIEPREKIGIIGRTGAGKSSVISALFRLSPAIEGDIKIDHLSTANLDIQELRRKISIIPQQPIFFSGTIRSNLDPFDKYPDETLWEALNQIEMKGFVQNLNNGLYTEISDSGSTFSVGQKQLLCLARAFIEKNKIIVLDEATASVDFQTDQLMQTCIRKTFKDCTVLAIAHRVDTIIDYDKVIVIDAGNIVKTGSPKDILDLGSIDSFNN